MSQSTRLKLRAEDPEDLMVIAACLQESFACVGEMAYDREARRFALILVRHAWEEALPRPLEERSGAPAQVKAGLHFDAVSAVKTRGIDQQAPCDLLTLITITSDLSREPRRVNLLFAGSEVCLEVERLLCHPRRPSVTAA